MAIKKTAAKKTTTTQKQYSAAAKKYTAPKAATAPKKSSTSKTAPGKTSTVKKTTTKKTTTAKKTAGKYLGKGTPWTANKGKKTPYYANTKKGAAKKGSGKKKPKFPSLQDYLMGDQYYQSGLSDLEWALEQFLTENDAAEGDLGASFDSAMGYMNLDKEKALEYLKDDYGARGLVFSGLYPDAVSDYNKEWSMGAADLNRDLASQMRDLGFEEQNMRQSTEMQKRDLRLDAIRRRQEEIQQSQFNNKAGFGGKKKAGAKKTAKKAPTKKATAKKTGTRKTGVRKLRKY